MKKEEMRERYKGEWVLISFGSLADLTEDLYVIQGEVVAHARTWREIKHAERKAPPANYTVEYMGEFDGDSPPVDDIDKDFEIIL